MLMSARAITHTKATCGTAAIDVQMCPLAGLLHRNSVSEKQTVGLHLCFLKHRSRLRSAWSTSGSFSISLFLPFKATYNKESLMKAVTQMMEEWIMVLWQPRAAEMNVSSPHETREKQQGDKIRRCLHGLGSNPRPSTAQSSGRLTWGGCRAPTSTALLSCSDTRRDYWRSASSAWLWPKSETSTTRDSDQGGRPENRETFLSLLDPLSIHTFSHSHIQYYLSRQQNQHDLSCLEQRPPPPTTIPTPTIVIRVSHHCREAGDKLDWVLDVLLRHLHHRAVLLLEGQQISATLGHPLVHLSTGETNFQRLTHWVCCSACPARPTVELFLIIRHICVAQRNGSLLMTLIFSFVLVFHLTKTINSLITAQFF